MSKGPSKLTKLYIGEGSSKKAIGEVKDWNLQVSKGTIDVSKLDTEWKEFLVGQSSWTASASVWYDPSDAAQEEIVTKAFAGVELTVVIQPQGVGDGKPEFSGKCYVTDWNPSGATEDAVGASVSFQGNGELKRTTQVVSG